ncbi:unnamed protein product [Nippostrongylus brasiliensis]|uniref:MADF domain-containing protein n=1 Tax=Nippostrongylus brasiliensis TaxID=27835 RepID=A0A0N4YTV5_NIPBR|nr:unnamed protein product [Nippostrongylus brasiliensis]
MDSSDYRSIFKTILRHKCYMCRWKRVSHCCHAVRIAVAVALELDARQNRVPAYVEPSVNRRVRRNTPDAAVLAESADSDDDDVEVISLTGSQLHTRPASEEDAMMVASKLRTLYELNPVVGEKWMWKVDELMLNIGKVTCEQRKAISE